MTIIKRFPPEHFLKYKEKPVKLKPFSQKQEAVAKIYLKRLDKLLKEFDLKLMIRGSTSFRILGKGDVEIGVYPKETDWNIVVRRLKKEFGNPGNVEEDYVRFNDVYEEIDVEIIMQKGEEATQDIKLHKYLMEHANLLKEYESLKKRYAFSKREYQIQKNKFLSEIVNKMAD